MVNFKLRITKVIEGKLLTEGGIIINYKTFNTSFTDWTKVIRMVNIFNNSHSDISIDILQDEPGTSSLEDISKFIQENI